MVLLDENLIRQVLNSKSFPLKDLRFHLFSSINSTNQFLKELITQDPLTVCCAETQTQGRGRENRTWFSPYAENIYCSSLWKLDCDFYQLSGLSLVVGLAILACFKEVCPNVDLKLKWPNDIFWKNKKLGGILIEITENFNHFNRIKHIREQQSSIRANLNHASLNKNIIIGIGLNINTDTSLQSLINKEKSWCSLYAITGKQFDRNFILGNLIYQLDKYINQFLSTGFSYFMKEWKDADFLYGKTIASLQGTKIIKGKAWGVNPLGQLSVEDEQGQFHFLTSGDTSVGYT